MREKVERFVADFEAALTEIMTNEESKEKLICPENMKMLNDICCGLAELMCEDEDSPKVQFMPQFNSGAISVEIPTMSLKGDEVLKLKEIVEMASNFTIVPLVNDGVRVSFTVQDVFK